MRASAAMVAILLAGQPGWASNSVPDVNQRAHSAWTVRSGAISGYPRSLAQTGDGYLWLGTEFGLLRFDGVQFVPWTPARSGQLSPSILKLLVTRDGSLWIGAASGLSRLKDGVLTRQSEFDGQRVAALVEDHRGVLWVGTSGGFDNVARLCRIEPLQVTCDSARAPSLGRFVTSLFEDQRHRLWVGAATGLWQWDASSPRQLVLPEERPEIHELLETDAGELLIGLNRDVAQLVDGRVVRYPVLSEMTDVKPTAMLRDRRGALWIGTQDQGVYHVRDGRVDRFSRRDGLSGDSVADILEDREGNVWVATLTGLDRFRTYPIRTLTVAQGLSSNRVLSVQASRDGSVWIGTTAGLNRWRNGSITGDPLGTRSGGGMAATLFEDSDSRLWVSSATGLSVLANGRLLPVRYPGLRQVHAMAEDTAKAVWVSEQDLGLLRIVNAQVADVTTWQQLDNRRVRSMAADPDGGLWLGFFQGGLAHYRDGQVRARYSAADGLGDGPITSVHIDAEAVWASTSGGVSRVADGRVATLSRQNGLPCEAVNWVITDQQRAVWLSTECGLLHIGEEQVAAWLRDSTHRVTFASYNADHGHPIHAAVGGYGPRVTRSPVGTLWYITFDGVAMFDPADLPHNAIPPPVHIERVVADGREFTVAALVDLQSRTRDVRIDYTALSLSIPERVSFRYRLEGRDSEWEDAGSRRQAFFTNLGPGSYRFRVIAANNDGVWNTDGAAVALTIHPAFYQTRWFRAGMVLTAAFGIWWVVRLRMTWLAAQMSGRFKERLNERTRIAQELHDTLLQGLVSVSMQLSVLHDEIVEPKASAKLSHILGRIGQVIEEGRNAVQDLRAHHGPAAALEESLGRDAEDFRGGLDIDIRIVVAGERQVLNPLIDDDIYRIAREALLNAIHHADARHIEIAIEYSRQQLRIRLMDDGRGIDPEILHSTLRGHWGIRGMRERAARIGAQLRFFTQAGNGMEVELVVPGGVARQLPKPVASD